MKSTLRRFLLISFFAALFFGSVVAHPALAQDDVTSGLNAVGEVTGLGSEDPRVVVLRFVRMALGFLGIIALILFVYAGFLWMTAGGDDERVGRAKRIMMNAVVGIIIILFSFSIVSFIISAILRATGGGNGSGGVGGGDVGPGLGGGSGREFVVTGVSPTGQIPIRNTVLQIVFSNTVAEDSLAGGVIVTPKAGGDALQGTVAVRNNRVTWTPTTPCPDPNGDRFCFDANTEYSVAIQTSIRNTRGKQLSCANGRCAASFTSGDLIDIESPRADMRAPGEGENVSADALIPTQVLGTDDSGITAASFAAGGVEFDAVTVPSGVSLRETLLETLWSTTGLTIGERYRLTGTVFDLAGNTDEDSVTVRVRGAWCFNGMQDAARGETGIDCGGDSASADFCGACAGSACTETGDCAAGAVCAAGVCVDSPRIDRVTPGSGAVGTFVSIKGVGFGTGGNVFFKGANGDIAATIPACVNPWSPYFVTVAVPNGAITGPIKLVTSAGTSDTTSDDRGPKIADFIVNDVKHPNLCSITPSAAAPDASFTLAGENFSDIRDDGQVLVNGDTIATVSGWGDVSITATVPRVGAGSYGVSVKRGGIVSNELQLSVLAPTYATPSITSITPDRGPKASYVTIKGSNFGDAIGKVWLVEKQSEERALLVDTYPEACRTTDLWTPVEVSLKVPDTFQNAARDGLRLGDYTLFLETREGAKSNEVNFTVTNDQPAPWLCAFNPTAGKVGTTVAVLGDHFGTANGEVTFTDAKKATVSSWSNNALRMTVPTGAVTGDVVVKTASGALSNAKKFTVGEGGAGAETPAPKAAEYHWWFSTGDVPAVPTLITECSDDRVSGVPNNRFTEAVCLNAVVFAEFSEKMLSSSLEGAVKVEKCTGSGTNVCGSTDAVAGRVDAREQSFTFTPSSPWAPTTTYRVRVTTDAQSERGVALERQVEWTFVTAAVGTSCEVQKVMVAPPEATLREEGATQDFVANAVNGCVVLNDETVAWSWAVPEKIATPVSVVDDPACEGPKCQRVRAIAEGVEKVIASARVNNSVQPAATGESTLTVKFTDPYVADYWPGCTSACRNAVVGGTFNVPVTAESLERGVEISSCDNELCTATVKIPNLQVRCVRGSDTGCIGYAVDNLNLDPSKYYRVVVLSTVVSESGAPLTKLNSGSPRGFAYTFRVREGDQYCAIDRVSVTPSASTVNRVGARQSFVSEAYGLPDACSVSGQRLVATSYNWSWIASDEDRDNNIRTFVAKFLGNRSVPADPDSEASSRAAYDVLGRELPRGCTGSCLAMGSERAQAICGNGRVETEVGGGGEDCDDGNVTNGDGCSAVCLREGALAVQRDLDGIGGPDVCGNGKIERNGSTQAGEDCDNGVDGKPVEGNGCSATCTSLGAQSVGATCGNRDIAINAIAGGEECDDGNRTPGDGCSAVCLREGSVTLTQLGDALCGNAKVEKPAEECDDGNSAGGDGCSARCLLEGSSSAYGSVCGNNQIEKGEACDDGNLAAGDGCSSQCLLEGSSYSYSVASICGDGVVGLGEVARCELDDVGNPVSGADDRIDPVQVAEIDATAPREVDPATGKAVATISAAARDVRNANVAGTASFTLLCSARDDQDCSERLVDGTESTEKFGRGEANCCYERPTASVYPQNRTECLNTSVSATFSTKIDPESLREKGANGAPANLYLELVLADGQQCPVTGYGDGTQAMSPFGVFMERVQAFAGIHVVDAAGTGCYMKVGYSIVPAGTGERVVLSLPQLLEKDSTYRLHIVGDNNTRDAAREGVRSADGVTMAKSVVSEFTTGSKLCTLDAVRVIDGIHPANGTAYTFTQKTASGQEHPYTATAVSYAAPGAPVEIAPVPTYDWKWTWVSDDNGELFDLGKQDPATLNVQPVGALGKSGEANIIATAKVQTSLPEFVNDEATVTGISGAAPAIAFICQNPWPALNAASGFPWKDPDYNVSVYYCLDAGKDGPDDDLPALTDVQVKESETPDVLREYIFRASSGDAIGLRIFKNPTYLSPAAWYTSRNFGGDAQATNIREFTAVADGRSTYVAVPNYDDDNADANLKGNIYGNIAVLSYSDNSGPEMQQVYRQFATNLDFATNVRSQRICYQGSAAVLNGNKVVSCRADNDCDLSKAQYCADERGKLARDIDRLGDMTDIARSVQEYGAKSGSCSATTSRMCSTSADCPAGESCQAIVPTIPSGSFIRSMATSAWPSWKNVLAGGLETELPVDPINAYTACGLKGGPFEKFADASCVDASTNTYACPAGSRVYTYRSIGDRLAEVHTDLEFNVGKWATPIDAAGDRVTVTVGHRGTPTAGGFVAPVCNDAYRLSDKNVCGDGVLGTTELCEIGQRGGTPVACDRNGDGQNDGVRMQVCNTTCNGWVNDSSAVCVAPACGDGIVQSAAGEQCDDGVNNGKYGFCGGDCKLATRTFCGDGVISAGEACDCGVAGSVSITNPDNRRASGGIGLCKTLNGTALYNGDYNTDAARTCSWDCAGPSNFCGDKKVTITNTPSKIDMASPEQCDGTAAQWAGELCNSKSYYKMPCADQETRENGMLTVVSRSACTADGGTCGGAAGSVWAACPVGQIRTRACNVPGTTRACMYTVGWGIAGTTNTTCQPINGCGNGKLDPGEECDDGNTTSSDSCAAIKNQTTGIVECKRNVCGDGYVDPATEQCDLGTMNGKACDASYGSSCTVCTLQCKNAVASGPYCGDGITNGSEMCDGPFAGPNLDDGQPVSYPRYTVKKQKYPVGHALYSTSSSGQYDAPDQLCAPIAAVSGTYTRPAACKAFGVCDGGKQNGYACVITGSGSSCDGGVPCKPAQCGQSCDNVCPMSFTRSTLAITPNIPGSRATSSAYLYSSALENSYPNAVTLTIPACRAARSVTADLDLSQVKLPDVYVVFVTDRSGSMSGANLIAAQDALKLSVEQLYDRVGPRMNIALVGFSRYGGTGMCKSGSVHYDGWDDEGLSCTIARRPLTDCPAGVTDCYDCGAVGMCDNVMDAFYGFSNEDVLQRRILEYTADGGTQIYRGLDEAIRLLKDVAPGVPGKDNVRKIVVLMTDGIASSTPSKADGTLAAQRSSQAIKDLGYELYTVGLGISSSYEDDLNGWSSNFRTTSTPKSTPLIGENGIAYSYTDASSSDLSVVYRSIVDSITRVTLSVKGRDANDVPVLSSFTTDQLRDVPLPLPSTFRCDEDSSQQVPVYLSFPGEGKIGISNLRLDYCPVN